jgi:hypothetical protein
VADPISSWTDDQLWNAQVMAQLACGKAHQALAHKRQQYFCLIFKGLKVESDLRGLPAPAPPLGVGSLRPNAL